MLDTIYNTASRDGYQLRTECEMLQHLHFLSGIFYLLRKLQFLIAFLAEKKKKNLIKMQNFTLAITS